MKQKGFFLPLFSASQILFSITIEKAFSPHSGKTFSFFFPLTAAEDFKVSKGSKKHFSV